MSENTEHISDDNETETKAMEDLPNDSCKSEAKLMNQTDTALLDDEEMPTYISMSSTSRPDDSDIINMKQQKDMSQEIDEDRNTSPYPSDDQAASSIYVLSSGEDEDQHPYNDEDDEDEYDSDDMENLELDNEFDHEHPNNMKHLMDEEDDDEDDEDEEEDDEARQIHDDDDNENIDNDYRMDYIDIRSDDFILNRKLENHDKGKSLSLQDLNEYAGINRNAEHSKRRRSFASRRNCMNIPQSAVMYPILNKKQPTRYHHVESKVKLYIKGIKEQNRRSMEKHMKHQENGINNKSHSDHENSIIKEVKPTNKTIKDYAEKTIKELEIAEACSRDKRIYTPIVLNGQDNKNCLESIHEECTQSEIQIHMPPESAQNKKDTRNVDDNVKNDYIIEQEHIQTEVYHNAEPMDVSDLDNNDICTLRIENIKSIRTMDDETKNNNEQIIPNRVIEEYSKTNCMDAQDVFKISSLREQLNRKTIQYNNLLEAYQKQVLENFKLKGELDELRKSSVKREKKNEPQEQKVASIQTDVDPTLDEYNNQAKPTHVKQCNNKILGNISTLSSIGEWSDSACNLSVSMKPPEAVKTLQSDDSMLLTDDTPRKVRPLSHAFLTSSRILQTLANITQGKTKPESPLVQNSKKRLNEGNTSMDLQTDDGSYHSQPSSSKKRKIADIFGPSSFLQSLKTSQTASESHPGLNDSSNVETNFKFDSINNPISEKVESQENIKTNQSTDATAEDKTENAGGSEDNVKCYVYHENEDSKDRSFLILAEESEKDKAVNEKGRIRECGPYLLGNVEVRMSEINGTINIWGKEISQESTGETEETETSKAKSDKKHSWQKTPHTRFNGSNLVCSTGKKLKTPSRFELSSVASNLSCPHTPSFNNTAKPSCSADKTHAGDIYNSSACISSCEVCDSSRHSKEWLKHKRIQEKLHSCCVHNIDVEQKYNCFLHKNKQKFEDNCNCIKERPNTKDGTEYHRHNSSRHLELNKHLHENITNHVTENNEPTCKYHMTCHHSLHDPAESCDDNHKYKREDCTCEPSMNTDRETNESCSHHSPNVHEEEPLITKQCEASEMRRRRLSGKRVREILMDFLRGCGDCYSPSVSNSNKGCMHKKSSCLTSCSPQIKITPCVSPEPTCTNQGQSVGRCCHAYTQRIESQLEEFRMEMERVRSRSDAILNMLNMLHSVEMN